MVMGEKVAIFDWEWGGIWAPRDGQKIPSQLIWIYAVFKKGYTCIQIYNANCQINVDSYLCQARNCW